LSSKITDKITGLKDPKQFIYILQALKNQINTFSIATLMIPIILFFNYINIKKHKASKNIAIFLITFIFLNFIISADHIYGYLKAGDNTNLLSRYINISIIYINLFALIFFFKYKKFTLHITGAIFTTILLISSFFLNYQFSKHSLNLDLSLFYNTNVFFGKNFIQDNNIIPYYFIPICLILFMLLIKNKKRIFAGLLISLLLLQTSYLYIWHRNFPKNQLEDPMYHYIRDNDIKANILFIESYKYKIVNFTYWRIMTMTKSTGKTIYYNDTKSNMPTPNFNSKTAKKLTKEYDYIISYIHLDLPIAHSEKSSTIYLINKDKKIAAKVNTLIQTAIENDKK